MSRFWYFFIHIGTFCGMLCKNEEMGTLTNLFFSNVDKKKEAMSLFVAGKRHLLVKEVDSAVDKFALVGQRFQVIYTLIVAVFFLAESSFSPGCKMQDLFHLPSVA